MTTTSPCGEPPARSVGVARILSRRQWTWGGTGEWGASAPLLAPHDRTGFAVCPGRTAAPIPPPLPPGARGPRSRPLGRGAAHCRTSSLLGPYGWRAPHHRRNSPPPCPGGTRAALPTLQGPLRPHPSPQPANEPGVMRFIAPSASRERTSDVVSRAKNRVVALGPPRLATGVSALRDSPIKRDGLGTRQCAP